MILFFAIVITGGILAFAGGSSDEYGYHTEVLDNGATVVSKYIPDSNITIIQIRVRSGLSNEGRFAGSGISHFLEHLLFKRTKTRSTDEIFKEIRRLGGIINGFTSLDSAAYHITIPNESFNAAFDLVSDMVMHPAFSDDDMEKERKVILEEMAMENDDPNDIRMDKLLSTAYMENIYKYPLIGYLDRFKELTKEDIIGYHKANYTPDNIVIGVVGGVLPQDVLAAACRNFADHARGDHPANFIITEPRQLSERESTVNEDVNMGYLAVGYHGTSLFSEDMYVLEIFSILAGNGRDSRLYQRLVVDKELLHGVSCSNMTPRYPGYLIITGEGDAGKLEAARKEIFSVIDDMRSGKTPVTEEELVRAKNIIISGYEHANEDIDSVVSFMTSSQMLTGSPDFYEKYLGYIEKVSAEDVTRVAAKYLDVQNSTTVKIVPRNFKSDEGQTRAVSSKSDNIPEKIILDNGVRLILKKRPDCPIASITLTMPGGIIEETPENNGISALTAALLLKGTSTRSEDEIVPAIEKLGGMISSSSGKNSIVVTVDVLSKDIDTAIDILQDVVRNPVFPEEELLKQKKKTLAVILESEKNISVAGGKTLSRLLYGDHPYSMTEIGELRSVEKITVNEITEFYKKCFIPAGVVIAVAGDIDAEHIRKKISDNFGSIPSSQQVVVSHRLKPIESVLKVDINMDKEQALFLVGFQGVTAFDEKRYPLEVLNAILSGGGGILFDRIREKEGLAYSCGSMMQVSKDQGTFAVVAKTMEKNLKKVQDIVQVIIEKIRKGDITEVEVEDAKSKLLTMYYSSLETNSTLSGMLATSEYIGVGYDNYLRYPEKIKMVKRDDIIAISREILTPAKCAIVMVHSSKTER
ncbi:MAG TPA: pitrilysin family protein [Candidatus Omnitrophota bacterium]|nr:pitrilysin family protein [Candidatus Omnitrophota bacterium]